MAAVLVSGAEGHVSLVADELRGHGAEVTEVVELDKVPAVCGDAGADAFDSYVQLPATFEVRGPSAVERVHHFYAEGVLARFPALAGALPALKPNARVTFVLGQLPVDAARSDDRDARRALVRVLADAACADFTDGGLGVRILDADSSPAQIALVALGRDPAREELYDELRRRFDETHYADWRVELLGLASVHT
jgi:hypothetical protein